MLAVIAGALFQNVCVAFAGKLVERMRNEGGSGD